MTLKCAKCNEKGIKSFMNIVAIAKIGSNESTVKIKCFKCGFSYTANNTKGVDKYFKT